LRQRPRAGAGKGARRGIACSRAGGARRLPRHARRGYAGPGAADRLHVSQGGVMAGKRKKEEPDRLLPKVDGPEDLKGLDDAQLQQLAQEVREYIIDTVGEIGGHFGANLGACELAVALHSLLESPRDKILWDVGHQ